VATYFTDDFADFSTDWTERYNTAGTWSVSSGNLTLDAGTTSDWRCLSWNDIDSDADRDDVEILVLLTTPDLGTAIYVAFARGSGADESASLYAARIFSSSWRVDYCAGSDTPTSVASVTATQSASTDYWFRMRINGSSPTSVKAKLWAASGSEPGTWAIDTTSSAGPTGTGWAGAAMYGAPSMPTWKQIGIGTNGDTAPSSGSTTTTADVTGVGATGSVGTVTAAFDYTAAVTGLQATSAVGSVTVVLSPTVTVTGVAATGAVGTVVTAYDFTVPITGVTATGAVGSVTVTTASAGVAAVTGVQATGSVGTVTTAFDFATAIVGVLATGAVGTVTVATSPTAAVAGVSASGAVGTVTVSTASVVVATVTGVAATGSSGTVTVALITSATVSLAGVRAIGSVGTVTVSGDIGGGWSSVADSTDSWTPVSSAASSWVEV